MDKVTDEGRNWSEVLRNTDQGVVINVRVQPRALKTECVGLHGNALKFRISAPPVDGVANEALCGYLAKVFRISKRSVAICSGQGARQKRVLIRGVSTEQVKEKLCK